MDQAGPSWTTPRVQGRSILPAAMGTDTRMLPLGRTRSEGRAVRVVACVALLALCVAMAGCRTFGKKSAGGGGSDRAAGERSLSDDREQSAEIVVRPYAPAVRHIISAHWPAISG